jgi:hypothetical protein
MNEPPQDLSSTELLERIVALEADNRFLKARLDDFQKGWKASLDTNLHQFKSIYDLLWPVVEKVFPGFRAMQSKVEALITPNNSHPSIDTRPQDFKRT